MRSGALGPGPFQQPGSWNMEATRHSTAPLREEAAAVLLVTDGDSGLDLHRSFVTVPTVTAEVHAGATGRTGGSRARSALVPQDLPVSGVPTETLDRGTWGSHLPDRRKGPNGPPPWTTTWTMTSAKDPNGPPSWTTTWTMTSARSSPPETAVVASAAALSSATSGYPRFQRLARSTRRTSSSSSWCALEYMLAWCTPTRIFRRRSAFQTGRHAMICAVSWR